MSAVKNLSIFNTKGEVAREMPLPSGFAGIKIKPAVVHQVVVGYAANKRAATAHTKNRSEVAGGGIKPWKQKGTGRARHGSIRSPLWVGGGVVFGPRNTRNYGHRLPGKLKKLALSMVLADYLTNEKVTIVETWPESNKTKAYAELFKKLKLDPRKKCLVLLTDSEAKAARGLKNLPGVNVQGVRQLNTYDGMMHSRWLMTETALKEVLKRQV